MRRAIARDFAALSGVRVIVTLDERFPDEPGPWETVRVGKDQEEGTLARLAAGSDYTVLIAPETGGTLAKRARLLEEYPGRSLGSSPTAIAWTGDKLWFGNSLRANGIVTPYAHLVRPGDGLLEWMSFPLVLKPKDGAGSIDTYFFETRKSFLKAKWNTYEVLLQEYVIGEPMSASFLVGRDGKARLIAVGRQFMNVIDSRFTYEGGRLPAPRELAEGDPRRAVELVSGLLGFVGVDFIRDEERNFATVLEINPRPTTSIVGLVRLLPPGLLAHAWIASVSGDGTELDRLDLAALIATQRPIEFRADGTIVETTAEGGDS